MPGQKPVNAEERFIDIHMPKAGLDLSMGFGVQPNRPTGQRGVYARTCAVANNVRAYEPVTNRSRGGQRAGLSKYLPARVAGTEFVVQCLAVVIHKG